MIKDDSGKVVFDLASYDFLKGDAPETREPEPLASGATSHEARPLQGHERIYQVRGFDVSTVSFIVADTGYIVVDPLTSVESAHAALDLVKEHVGDKPVVAVIYSHSHADHFGGVAGVTTRSRRQGGPREDHRAGGLPRTCGRRERHRRPRDDAARALSVRHHAAARTGRRDDLGPWAGHFVAARSR